MITCESSSAATQGLYLFVKSLGLNFSQEALILVSSRTSIVLFVCHFWSSPPITKSWSPATTLLCFDRFLYMSGARVNFCASIEKQSTDLLRLLSTSPPETYIALRFESSARANSSRLCSWVASKFLTIDVSPCSSTVSVYLKTCRGFHPNEYISLPTYTVICW